jgi:hypothetical protein
MTAAKARRGALMLFIIGVSYSMFFYSYFSQGLFLGAGLTEANAQPLGFATGMIVTTLIFGIGRSLEATRKSCPWLFSIVFGLTPPLLFAPPYCAFYAWRGWRLANQLRAAQKAAAI